MSVDVPVADLVVSVAHRVVADEASHLLACLGPASAADRVEALRAGWGVVGGGGAWMPLDRRACR